MLLVVKFDSTLRFTSAIQRALITLTQIIVWLSWRYWHRKGQMGPRTRTTKIGLIRILFSLSAVGCVKLFRVQFSFTTKHPTRLFYFFCVILAPGFCSFVYDVTARLLLVAYGRCLWPLGACVIVM